MIKTFSTLCIIFIIILNLSLTTSDTCIIIQNKPGIVGQTITFTLDCGTSGVPNVAWDFGDGGGFGKYKTSLTTTHTYYTPGVYRVFARIQGEDIPLSMVQTIVNPILTPSPLHSSTIVADVARNTLWTANTDNNSITCIDADKLNKLMEIPVGKNPRTLDLDKDGNVWVANEGDASLWVVSPTGSPIKSIKLPFASRPFGICFDPARTTVYVTLQATNKLIRLDPQTGKITGEINVGRNPRGIAITSDGRRLFVTRFVSPVDHGEITEIDPAAMSQQRIIEMPLDTTPDFDDRGRGVPNFLSSLTVSPDGKTLWVPCKKDNTSRGLFRDGLPLNFDNTVRTIVSQIDLTTNKENVPFRRDINDSDLACAVEFSPYGNIAFVALQGNNKIQAIDVYTNARIGSFSTGLTPQGMVFSPDGYKLFVHNVMSRTVRVFDTRDIILSTGFIPKELATLSTITNEKLTPDVLLGKQIFYNSEDKRMSKTGYISCGSCHLDGLSDERVWDFTDRGEGFRNTHALSGHKGMGMGNVHWTGNFDEIQDFENDMRNGFGGSGFLSDAVFNSGSINDPLGDKKAGLSPELDALAAYVASLNEVHASPHRNQDGTLTDDAKEGKKIFNKLECGKCHGGKDFTDKIKPDLFHDVGTILPSSGKRRNMPLTGIATPTLKGIWETSPYLHDGSAETLKDVLTVKNPNGKHGNTSSLSSKEMDQLVSFLLQIDENNDVINGIQNSSDDKAEFSVFPNPAKDNVTISYQSKFQNSLLNSYIIISNSLGQTVYSSVIRSSTTEIPVKNFLPGMYWVTLFDGTIKVSKQLIIQGK